MGSELISEAQAHMGHIDTQHPKQTFFLALGNLPKRPKKALHVLIIFRKSAGYACSFRMIRIEAEVYARQLRK